MLIFIYSPSSQHFVVHKFFSLDYLLFVDIPPALGGRAPNYYVLALAIRSIIHFPSRASPTN